MKADSPTILSTIEEDSGLTLEASEDIKTEDPKSEYDAVIVLAE